MDTQPPVPAADVAEVLRRLPARRPRVLLLGAMGTGKSTLAAGIAAARGGRVCCIGADPGSPAFGAPGSVTLARWHGTGWQPLAAVPLCTLDAARFRLPLVRAVAALAQRAADQPAGDPASRSAGAMLIVDSPGVVRGVAAAELLHGLVDAAAVNVVLVLGPERLSPELHHDLGALDCARIPLAAHPATRRPSRAVRESLRTERWDACLADAAPATLNLDAVNVTGTPPPRTAPQAWQGRQIALLRRSAPVHAPLALGEVAALEGATLHVSLAGSPEGADTLLIRDARRNAAGRLVTAPRPPAPVTLAPRSSDPDRDAGHAPLGMAVGGVRVELPNGVLGDPLVELRPANAPGLVLFDLGDAAALSVKTLHAVTHVFLSHAHMDHIGGFLDLLRARLSGRPAGCRLHGPPGTAGHVAAFVAGIHWDRIGEGGPAFDVAEVHPQRLLRSRIQPGRERMPLPPLLRQDTRIASQGSWRVHGATLDHGIPVLAYVLEVAHTLKVREQALAEHGWPAGPWLGALKHHLSRDETAALVTLPDGRSERAGVLGSLLVERVPGTRVAYATDLADTPANRAALARLARDADLLICEATFLADDAEQARATGHLTARACAEIALEAGVRALLPFHFSRRYSRRLPEVYRVLREVCRGTTLDGQLVGPAALVRP